MPLGWEGKLVRLVPLDAEQHLANALMWFNDPHVTRWTVMGDMPLTRLAEEEYFARMSDGRDRDVALAVETLHGEHVGFTGLHRIDWRHGFATSGTLIGRPDLWGRGLGTETVKLRTEYAFDVLGLRVLLSEVIDGNQASLRILAKAGYREVGRIPQRYWKRGAYRDLILLAVSRDAAAPTSEPQG